MTEWENNCNETWIGNMHSWEYSYRKWWFLKAVLLLPPFQRVCRKCGKKEYRRALPEPWL